MRRCEMKPYTWEKQPDAKRTLEFDVSKSLATGDSISLVSVAIYHESTDLSSSMIDGSPIIDGDKFYVTLYGGTDGETYWLKLTITTANGDIIPDDLKVIVKERGK